MTFPLHLLPLIPLGAAAFNLLFGRRLSRDGASLLAVGAVGASFLLAVTAFLRSQGLVSGMEAAPLHETWYTWIAVGTFKIEAAFLLDALSGVMCLIVTGVGLLIHIYSIGYMSHERDYARYFGYLNLFTGSMLVLVLGDNLVAAFVGWEGVGVCSYLLIGFWYSKEMNASAGRKAFITNRIGDFGFLLGIFLLLAHVGTVTYAGLATPAAEGALRPLIFLGKNTAFWAAILLFVGATGKSAQLPLYVWLPDAMAGPTPVSALIHAATMVTAGVYMVVRLHFLYAMPGAFQVQGAVMIVGCATAFWAALIAIAQTDIKKVLAYSTISQLGFMFVGAAAGVPQAGIFHLMTHAFFKAGLFLGAGSVMHAMSDRTEILEMGGLRKKIPWTHATFLVFTLAIAGCPPLAGFWSKDAILASALRLDVQRPLWHHFGTVIALILVAVAAMTSFYMFRLYYLVFSGTCRAERNVQEHIHESPPVMTVPLVILALLSLVGGLVGTPWRDLLGELLGAEPELHVGLRDVLPNMMLGLGAFAIGWAAATSLYRTGVRQSLRNLVTSRPRLYQTFVRKFYVDELYDRLFVRPLKLLAQSFYSLFDRFLIDTLLVGGTARVVDGVGYLAKRIQNGDVQRYVAIMVIGAAVLIWRLAPPPGRPDFHVQNAPGGRVHVEAVLPSPPSSPAGAVHYCWKIDEQATCASQSPSDLLHLPRGSHKVTLEIRGAGRPSLSLSHTVEVQGS